jgi:hypothetical protein
MEGQILLTSLPARTSNPGRIDVSCLKKALRGKRNVALSFWFKHANTTGVMAFFSLTNRLSNNSHDYIIFWYPGTLAFVLRNASGTQLIYKEATTANTGITYNDGNWHHVVATHGDAGSKVWIDNKLCIDDPDTDSWDSVDIDYALIGSARRIATNDEFFYPYIGSMSDLIIIDKQVDAPFVRKLYQDDYGFDLIWLGGQSNMEGRGTIEAGVDDNYTQTTGKVFQYPVKANSVPATLGTSKLKTQWLDGLSSTSKSACRGAYALINVNSSYLGPIIKFRRSSDSVTADFWFSQYGQLVDALGVTVSTWLGGNTAFVDTWYDQSGLGNHARQTTVTLQPFMVAANFTAGTMDFRTNKFLSLPDATVPVGSGAYTLLGKHGVIGTGFAGIVGGGTNGPVIGQALSLRKETSGAYRCWWYGLDHIFGTADTNNVAAETYDGVGTRRAYVNGTLVSTMSMTGRSTTAVNNTIGSSPGTNLLNGELYFVYVFSGELTAAEVASLSANHYTPAVTNATNTLDFPRNFTGRQVCGETCVCHC